MIISLKKLDCKWAKLYLNDFTFYNEKILLYFYSYNQLSISFFFLN